MNSNLKCSIVHLPIEILSLIFTFQCSSAVDVVSLERTCTYFYKVVNSVDNLSFNCWVHLVQQHFDFGSNVFAIKFEELSSSMIKNIAKKYLFTFRQVPLPIALHIHKQHFEKKYNDKKKQEIEKIYMVPLVCVIGSPRIGKTALVLSFVMGQFVRFEFFCKTNF